MSWTALEVKARKAREVISDAREAASGFLGPVLGLHFKKVKGREQSEM